MSAPARAGDRLPSQTKAAARVSRALTALARVRSFREEEARLGLAAAAADRQAAEDQLAGRRDALSAEEPFQVGSPGQFLIHRAKLTGRVQEMRAAAAELEQSQVVLAAAQGRWIAARTAQQSVEDLLGRRIEAARTEAEKAIQAEIDDISATAWLRRREDQRP